MSMMRGSITEDDRNFIETWQNISESKYGIVRLDNRGGETREAIAGSREFMLTTEDRLITQNKIISKAKDPFTNGTFRPIVVPANVTVESNPNSISDDEIKGLLVQPDETWDAAIAKIDSLQTLRRMLRLADGSDVTMRRYRQIENMVAEKTPKVRITQQNRDQYERLG
jgi:hypothetical protein